MAESLTDAEERALYGDPSKRTPVEVEVVPDPGAALERVRALLAEPRLAATD